MPNKSERGGDQRGPTGRMAKDPRPARRPLQPFDRPRFDFELEPERSAAVIVWVAAGLAAWLGLGFGILWWAQR